MEAWSPSTRQTQTSHLRSSSQYTSQRADPTSKTCNNEAPTRSDNTPQQQQQHYSTLSAPASQESFVSLQSHDGSSGSGNVSQLTSLTDPTSPHHTAGQEQMSSQQRYVTSMPDFTRMRTPEEEAKYVDNAQHNAFASPMSVVTSPNSTVTNGTKRTASGHVKNAPSLPNTPMTATFGGSRSRADSISSNNSRAGELAANLKTRLGYAMAKVQNGWEHKNISEVEQLAAARKHGHVQRHSMSHLDYQHRSPPLLSNGTAGMNYMYDTDYQHYSSEPRFNGGVIPPRKRISGRWDPYAYAPPPEELQTSSQPTPRLQPAPDIRPGTSHRYSTSYSSSSQPLKSNSVMSPPRTPTTNGGRAPRLRTEMQTAEAERDALQALFQLGSPHTSSQVSLSRQQNASEASSLQASPLRAEFASSTTPRRVTFARSESDSSSRVSMSEGGGVEARMQEV